MLIRSLILCACLIASAFAVRDRRETAVADTVREKFSHFRDNCFPRGAASGCKCTMTLQDGTEKLITFDADDKCKKPVEFETAKNKKKLNEEFKEKFGGLKDGCFPRPGGKGCRCTEKGPDGHDVEKRYDSDADCKVPTSSNHRVRRGNLVARPGSPTANNNNDQNVRDPVRERAQQNYAAVIQELKDKFRGLREGCFPRPKGCQCVVGKTSEGRDILDRRYKDEECKCKPNERSKECPAPGA